VGGWGGGGGGGGGGRGKEAQGGKENKQTEGMIWNAGTAIGARLQDGSNDMDHSLENLATLALVRQHACLSCKAALCMLAFARTKHRQKGLLNGAVGAVVGRK